MQEWVVQGFIKRCWVLSFINSSSKIKSYVSNTAHLPLKTIPDEHPVKSHVYDLLKVLWQFHEFEKVDQLSFHKSPFWSFWPLRHHVWKTFYCYSKHLEFLWTRWWPHRYQSLPSKKINLYKFKYADFVNQLIYGYNLTLPAHCSIRVNTPSKVKDSIWWGIC